MAQFQLLQNAAPRGEGSMQKMRKTILTGQIVSINESSRPDGSWVMGHIESEDGSTRIPFVGTDLFGCEVGRSVRLVGEWEYHPKHGRQFRAEYVESRLPVVREAIIKYIAANIPHCGPKRAEELIDHFGLSCLDILAHDPGRVREVFPGKVGEKMLDAWAEWAQEYQLSRRAKKLTIDLMGAGMTYTLARRVQQVFKKPGEAEDILLHRPYRLVEVPGIGFKRADQIARHMGIALDDPARIAAGVVYALDTAMEYGHSALPQAELEKQAARELDLDDTEAVRVAIERGLAAGTLVCDRGLVYLPRVRDLEEFVAQRLAEFLRNSHPLTVAERERVQGIIERSGLSETQARAVWVALENGVAILTGRPGSGKTTTTRTFVECCDALGWTVAIAAPTGKAAARAAEVTKRPASTVHRLIGGAPGMVREQPLPYRVIVLDETSMADLETVAWLLKNVDPRQTSILFVGDKDQLPSVGHGRVFADLIESQAIPTVELRDIFRQGVNSRIVLNAHRLLDGKPLLLDNAPGSDFLFADVTQEDAIGPDGFPIPDDSTRPRREQEEALRRLDRAIQFLIRQKGAVPVRDIQVLAPMRKGLLGVDNLNIRLQELLNPHGELGPEIGGRVRVRVGDRVIQTRNDYGVPGGLFNGEQGEVIAVDARREMIKVRFDDRILELRGVQLAKLRLAWAITVHRSQGSEFPYTILLYHTAHSVMLDNSLLYTAITRARRLFILIGNYRALELTRRQARRRDRERYTGLRERVADHCAALSAAA